MTACACQWIDVRTGDFTPDVNPAIGIAICFERSARGVGYRGGFPICATHAATIERGGHYSWPGTDHEVYTLWTVEPFAP